MKPKFAIVPHVVAPCPECQAPTTFESGNVGNGNFNRIAGVISGRQIIEQFQMLRCSVCGRGGLVAFKNDKGKNQWSIEEFYPVSVDQVALPNAVPEDIEAEFREAEKCMAHDLNRAASAMLRSTLERTLKANGYVSENPKKRLDLFKRIEMAAADGVITESLKTRAHKEIRVLGNDVLHDEYRKIESQEVEDSHHYVQRILEAFYDHRDSVESTLREKGRLADPTPADQ